MLTPWLRRVRLVNGLRQHQRSDGRVVGDTGADAGLSNGVIMGPVARTAPNHTEIPGALRGEI